MPMSVWGKESLGRWAGGRFFGFLASVGGDFGWRMRKASSCGKVPRLEVAAEMEYCRQGRREAQPSLYHVCFT